MHLMLIGRIVGCNFIDSPFDASFAPERFSQCTQLPLGGNIQPLHLQVAGFE
jgi:hypothetical protein